MTAVNIDIISDIKSATIDALKALYELDFDADKLVINETRKEFEGSFTVVCFPILQKRLRKHRCKSRRIRNFL